MRDIGKASMVGRAHTVFEPPTSPLIIIATTGTGGDIQPFITLAQGLLERRHRVVMLVPRFQEIMVQGVGVPYQTSGTYDEGQAILNDPNVWDERKGWGVVWNGIAAHLGAIRQLVQQLPAHESCAVLCHPILVPLAALARSVRPDLRIIVAYLAPSNLCSSHDMLTAGSMRVPAWVPITWRKALWKLIHKTWIDPVTLPSLNAARAQHNLPQVPHFYEHLVTAPNASLGLFPNWFASIQPDWPQSFSEGDFVPPTMKSPASLPPELEDFLSEGEPPVVFTPGTGHRHAAQYFNTALKALNRLGRRGLFVTPHASQIPESLPAHVMWQAHVPFTVLLPRAAAVVHHGGIGTTADALRSGTPQLIVPFAYDQFDNGLRARRLGVAEVLLAKRLSVRRLQTQLAHLLASHQVKQACGAIAQTMAETPGLPWLLDRTEAALFETSRAAAAT